jgi:sporulation protein YlmC with PRC-barrel domain
MKINANLPCLSALLAVALLLSGCASHSYMGVSLKPGGADPAVQALAARASIGDKQAQLDLGIRFEEGAGVARDLDTAKKLYHQAASDSGGSRLLLVPSSSGLTTSVVGMGPKIAGNAAAQARLQQLTSAQKMKQNHIKSGIGGMANHATESKGINMIRNLNKLANIPAGTLKVSDVSEIFGKELTKTESGELGNLYNNDINNNEIKIKLFLLKNRTFNFGLSGSKVEQIKLDDSKDFLLKNNWIHEQSIRQYIFVDTFYNKNKNKRIIMDSNGENLREISMVDINVAGVD